ncbi:hypothetical protein ACT89N_08500 [Stenotrophomonas maltophilia]
MHRCAGFLTQQLCHGLHQQPHVRCQLGDLLALLLNDPDQAIDASVSATVNARYQGGISSNARSLLGGQLSGQRFNPCNVHQ